MSQRQEFKCLDCKLIWEVKIWVYTRAQRETQVEFTECPHCHSHKITKKLRAIRR